MQEMTDVLKVLVDTLKPDAEYIARLARHARAERRTEILWKLFFAVPLLFLEETIMFGGLIICLGFCFSWGSYFNAFADRPEQNLESYLSKCPLADHRKPIISLLSPDGSAEQLQRLKNRDKINLLITILLAAAIAVGGICVFSGSVFTRQSAESAQLPAYMADNGQVTVYNWQGDVIDGVLTIPSEVDGMPVTAIGKNAFAGRSDLRRVEIPEGIVLVDSGAFMNCSRLKQVVLPQSLTELGAQVFENCSRLESCTIPQGVSVIRAEAFQGCTSLEQITLPQSMPGGKISEYAFEGCRSLNEISIPEGVIKISARAFYGCTMLSGVRLPSTLEVIGSSAFRSCSSLKSIMIPRGCSVDERAFKDSPTKIW